MLATLRARFEKHRARHDALAWADIDARIGGNGQALATLQRMEDTGGEPDVIAFDAATGVVTFCDCSAESPAGRRSLCYDREARTSRKENAPAGSAVEMAGEIGIELLTEEEYHALQQLGRFDTKTSSWLKAPDAVRTLGGAIFGDRRYDRVFVYHNGAQSYYAARGFRGMLRV
ncbi:DUF4256 domain-containing protein [Gemmatimonas sp.]|uniref:DUF4256 domain-containing protein n=1 Tax=Gemmatimonas sp. TaxID=1962908 RepID=UPI0027B900F1|nr:DUF4256 domain-containing protein [Gemmatimonas sp.]